MKQEPTAHRPEGLSLIIPCYNEEGGIAQALAAVSAVLEQMPVATELIVVDDGSTDGTAGRIDEARCKLVRNEENPGSGARCKLVRHAENLGYGAALKTGAAEAQYNCLAIIDADGTYPVEELPKLYEGLSEAEMVVGARTGKSVHIPLLRRPAKWALRVLANYLTGRKIPDLNSGLRAMRRELWDRYERYYPNGFSLTTTITLASLVDGRRVKFHSIDYHKRAGTSKIRPVRDTANFLQLILRTVLYFNPLKVFGPVGAAFIFAGVFIGVFTLVRQNYFEVGQFLDVTTLLLITSGVQILALGALADLISKRLS